MKPVLTPADLYPRGRDTSRALTEARTVLSRAETALASFRWPQVADDPDADEIVEALEEVVALLRRWKRTGPTRRPR